MSFLDDIVAQLQASPPVPTEDPAAAGQGPGAPLVITPPPAAATPTLADKSDIAVPATIMPQPAVTNVPFAPNTGIIPARPAAPLTMGGVLNAPAPRRQPQYIPILGTQT